MGYSTNYELKQASDPLFSTHIEEHVDYSVFDDSCKWYEHEQDIATVMVQNGVEHVEVHGEGEEQGDVWDKVFRLQPDGRTVQIEHYTYEMKRCVAPAVSKLKPVVTIDIAKLARAAMNRAPVDLKKQADLQRIDFAYGQLASSTRHKPTREAFASVAESIDMPDEEFAAWADGKTWAS